MNIKTWSNFSKRRNSTKQPTGGTTISCVLKETTSIEKPTFVFASNDFSINYVEAFGHYYFVDDIKSVRNNIIEVSCSQDVLATYKSNITGSSQYIERCKDSNYYRIPDPMNPPGNICECKNTSLLNLTAVSTGSPIPIIDWMVGIGPNRNFILGVSSEDGVTYYGLTGLQLSDLYYEIYGNGLSQYAQQLYRISDNLVSLKAVPYSITWTGSAQYIKIGKYTTNTAMGYPLPGGNQHRSAAPTRLNVPSDDHISVVTYIDYEPYSTASVYLPFVGVVSLDMKSLGLSHKLGVDFWLDPRSGDVIYKFLNDAGVCIGTYQGNASSEVPLSSTAFDPKGILAGVVQTIGGVAMMAAGHAGGLGLAASGLVSAARSAELHTQNNGTLSSFVGIEAGFTVVASVITQAPVEWDVNNMTNTQGILTMKQMALSGLSGYVKCRNASVDIPGYEGDKEAIEGFMNSGFYIE